MDQLWGKYHTSGRSLLQHTWDVVDAGDALFRDGDGPSRLGECWLRFFKLPPSAWDRFYTNLLAAEWLHDWGKANDGMQRVLTGRGEQQIRHEHFSALLIGLPVVAGWLKRRPGLSVPLVQSAVLTHHLQAGGNENGWADLFDEAVVRLECRETAFAELVRQTGNGLGIPAGLDVTAIPDRWIADGIRGHRERIQGELQRFRAAILKEEETARLHRAVRGALIVADAAGSALPRVGTSTTAWVRHQFGARELWTGSAVWEIIDRRLRQIEEQRGQPFKWNEFQEACDHLSDRALLLAPCGSGKTLAAWRWIAAQAKARPVGRVLFLYPTRATAKEGFRDYVSWAPEADAALMHGNAAFDLDGMFGNGDSRAGRGYTADPRLYSLGYWPRRVFSATVDQFLAFLQHGYGSTCMLPVLADSVVVIDEVHSFDRGLFSALKQLLKEFNVPVLCMTATILTGRRNDLEGCGLAAYEDKPGQLKEIAGAKRYSIRRVGSRHEAFKAARQALTDGRRVLWVANTVRRCHQITAMFVPSFDQSPGNTRLVTTDGFPVLCYHSRFQLMDRVERHEEIVHGLKAGRRAALGVTTQVCEMSLDLDVDLLVTECCPVTALIQRMGRCNRDRVARPLPRSGEVLVYEPDDGTAPYEENDLKGVAEFLGLVDGKSQSQLDLEAALAAVPAPDYFGDKIIQFLARSPYALGSREDDPEATGLRDGTDFNRPCILRAELDRYRQVGDKEKPGFVVPVPQRRGLVLPCEGNEALYAGLPGHLGVATDRHYHRAVGFCDRPLTEWGTNG